MTYRPQAELSGQNRVSAWRRDRHEEALPPTRRVGGKPMTPDFIIAQDVILDPGTGKIIAVVRNGEVWRDGTRIAVLIDAHMYDLNGNLLGKLAKGAGSLPISFKNLVEPSGGQTSRESRPSQGGGSFSTTYHATNASGGVRRRDAPSSMTRGHIALSPDARN
jgi:hypothetical protein